MRFSSRRSTVFARNGMVATSQPLAAVAGLRILMDGGNAVDAAVAAAAVLAVVEPRNTGIGGDVFALIWPAREKRVKGLNASGRAPAAASIEELRARGMTGIPPESAYAVTVPGALSGWEAALRSDGTMPLSEVLKPAINYASTGYPVSEFIGSVWYKDTHRLLSHASGQELLLDGRSPDPGELMRMPELARTLRAIAEGGSEVLYRGPLGQEVARFVQKLGGWLSTDDLARHEPTWVEPVYTDYRGVRCWECPPNTQGLNALMALNLAEGFDIASMGFQTPDTYHHLIECMRLAFADGQYHITDPEKYAVPTAAMLSKAYAAERRRLISPSSASADTPRGVLPGGSETVYIACVDREGNACSLINSVFRGFGSGLVVPGTGIALQNRGESFSLDSTHPNALAPHKRPYHTLIPGMATRDGELWLTFGVMGGDQQAQGHLQVLVNMIDFGLTPQGALDAPRFSVRPGGGVHVEDLVPAATVRALGGRGHTVMVRPPDGMFFGSGQVIERDPETGVLKAGSEPRADGVAVGW